MKILLIHSDSEKALAETLKLPLLETGFQVETLQVQFQEKVGIDAEILTNIFFNQSVSEQPISERDVDAVAPTHAVIISPLGQPWIDFLVGFSCGSHVPFMIYGKEAAKSIQEIFRFCFKFFAAEKEFLEYFNAESELFKKMDEDKGAKTARDALLEMGVPVSEKALVQCVCDGSLREVLFFLAAGFSPDTRNKDGVPIISIAARNGNREIMRFLFLAGAKLDLQSDDRGTSPLIDGVIGNHYDIVMDLIKAGVDLDVKSKDGQTAMIVAAGAGKEELVAALLKAGADPDIPDSIGMSARKYAILFHKSSLMSLFDIYPPKKEA